MPWIRKRITSCGGWVGENYNDFGSLINKLLNMLCQQLYIYVKFYLDVKDTWHLFIFQGVETNDTEISLTFPVYTSQTSFVHHGK